MSSRMSSSIPASGEGGDGRPLADALPDGVFLVRVVAKSASFDNCWGKCVLVLGRLHNRNRWMRAHSSMPDGLFRWGKSPLRGRAAALTRSEAQPPNLQCS
ncbi:hypothetical protein amb2987 [Paramagnetospirillum magneticum AMB-1]|uniref:Uncharacterized protein n=1 Tax=Paramagnetospirillum magneticum (strain ATCC 700264 / AMB-1) TaxID=342108 RepID=Q2W2Y4_PARM1|nr:hypothetical protein amb2987 [Paramagnetospirillum magneticum AMB-1]